LAPGGGGGGAQALAEAGAGAAAEGAQAGAGSAAGQTAGAQGAGSLAGALAAQAAGAQGGAARPQGGALLGGAAAQLDRQAFLGELAKSARLILDGGKSEMLMSLKPESLGKVALKLVSENGEVSARFLVGSEEARRALEAAMPELRETLQKAGLSVQGCEVQVRQDGAQQAGFGGEGRQGGGQRAGQGGSSGGADGGTALPDAARKEQLLGRYYSHESSVLYTA
jgi:flagellar hook-length control protein FliK